jgi:hypothetical protein
VLLPASGELEVIFDGFPQGGHHVNHSPELFASIFAFGILV